jgi:diguanylate cyclase (GGDEF)-like protein
MPKITNRKLEAVTIALILAMSMIVAIASVLTFRNNKSHLEAEVHIARINEQLRRLDAVLMTLQDAETGQRGYLLTSNRAYLEPYANALKGAEISLDNLESALRDEPRFRPQLDELRHLKEQKFHELAHTIALADEGEDERALAVVNANVGKMRMDRIRFLIAGIEQEKHQQLANIRAASLKQSKDATISMYLFSGTIVVLLFSIYLYLVYDLRERRRLARRAEFLESYDELTGLYCRRHFRDLSSHAMKQAFRDGRRAAVLIINLNNFKEINDQYGYVIGNAVLMEVGNRLLETARKGDQVARMRGNEFGLLVPDMHSEEELATLSSRLIDAVTPSWIPEMPEKYVSVSIGIAISPEDGQSAAELLSHANAAMHQARSEPGSRYRFCRHAIDASPTRIEMLTTGLHRAVEEQSFSLRFQPLVDTNTQKAISLEALLRWEHPELGAIAPDEFIPIAERTGLIIPIGAWVLNEACTHVHRWNSQGCNLRAAVNISAVDLIAANFADILIEALAQTGLPPSRLELEITERVLMNPHAETELRKIRNLGVHISIDDFGTGFSSLSYLSQFSIDVLKIDKSFITNIPQSEKDCGLVKSIIGIGKELGIAIVAEGIETDEQAQFLKRHGCDIAQGYLFCKPVSPREIGNLITAGEDNIF